MRRLLPCLCTLLLLASCAQPAKPEEAQFFAMDTVMAVTAYGSRAADCVTAVEQQVNHLDALWSRTRADSEISQINLHAGDATAADLSPETARLLQNAADAYEHSGGAFNPLMAPIMDAWGFTKDAYRVPSREELTSLLPLTVDLPVLGYDSPDFTHATASLPHSGQELDLGGIAKGQAAAMLMDVFRGHDITSALLALGGNITAVGTKPDGSPWTVAVKDPRNTDEYLCVFPLTDRTCATSGGYERFFTAAEAGVEGDATLYHHIIDPQTGYPAESGLASVTVVSDDPLLTDIYSTACYVMGAEAALDRWSRSDGDFAEFDLILVTDENHVYVTEGLEQNFDFRGEQNGYTYEIIRR